MVLGMLPTTALAGYGATESNYLNTESAETEYESEQEPDAEQNLELEYEPEYDPELESEEDFEPEYEPELDPALELEPELQPQPGQSQPTPEFTIDRNALSEAIAEAESLYYGGFTLESWEALEYALEAALYVYENEFADQDDIDAAVYALLIAIESLEPVNTAIIPIPTSFDNYADEAIATLNLHSFTPVVQTWTGAAAGTRTAAIDQMRSQVNTLLDNLDVTATVPAPSTGVSDFPNPPANFGVPPTNRTFTVNITGNDGSSASTTIIVSIEFLPISTGTEIQAAISSLNTHNFTPVIQPWTGTPAATRTAAINAMLAQINSAFTGAGVTGVTAALPLTINELPTLNAAGLPAEYRTITVNLTGPSGTFGSTRITVNLEFPRTTATGVNIPTAPFTGRTHVIPDSTLQFNATVLPAGLPPDVAWSVEGHSGASISATGLLTIGAGVPVGTALTVRAETTTDMNAQGYPVTNQIIINVVAPITVYVSIEGFTVGHGFYVEPTAVRIPSIGGTANTNATLATYTLLSKHDNLTFTGSSSGLTRIGGLPPGPANPPPFMLDAFNATAGVTFNPNAINPAGLGNGDFGSMFAGWMYSHNHVVPMTMAGSLALQEGDVIRWMFSVIGNDHGTPEQGGGMGFAPPFFLQTDKTALIRALSTANISSQARQFALDVIINPLASDTAVAAALAWILDGTPPNTNPVASSIALNRTAWNNAARGASQTFTARVYDQFGNAYANQDVIWTLVPGGTVAGGPIAEVHPNTTFSTGVVTIYAQQSGGAMVLTATSAANSNVSFSASVATARPVISLTLANQPALTTIVTAGEITGSLSAAPTVNNGGTLSYRWYRASDANRTGSSIFTGITTANFQLPLDLRDGTHFFYVEISTTLGALINPLLSRVATVTVNPGQAIPVDKTGLNTTIAQADSHTQADYTPLSWNAMQTALTAAIIVHDNLFVSQSEVDYATSALTAAIDGLIPIASLSDLSATISQAQNLEHGIYSSTSWSAMQTALTEAIAVRDNPYSTQTAISEARFALILAIDALLLAEGWEIALSRALAYIRGIVTMPDFGHEWVVLALARSSFDDQDFFDSYYSRIVAHMATQTNNPSRVNTEQSTYTSRVVLAVSAIGRDARDIGRSIGGSGPHNLVGVGGLADLDWANGLSINNPIYAMIALDTHQFDLPVPGNNITTREALIQRILDEEANGGGWSLMYGGNPTPDITGMALQALAPYNNTRADITAAINRAIDWLSQEQTSSGGWLSGNIENSQGTAQVIIALTALGIDPTTDNRFTNGYNNPITALLAFQHTDGGFRNTWTDVQSNESSDPIATEQAALALVAYYRFVRGFNSLYDMRDTYGGTVTPPTINRAALNAAITEAEARLQEQNRYTVDSRNALQAALAIAEAVDANANQLEIDTATIGLQNAIRALVPMGGGTGTPQARATIRVIDLNYYGLGQPRIFAPTQTFNLVPGDTAYSLLRRTGLTISSRGNHQWGGMYVSAINGWGEFSDGDGSGWNVSVNGVFITRSASLQVLNDGDNVEWLFTRDLGGDIGHDFGSDGIVPPTAPTAMPPGTAAVEAEVSDNGTVTVEIEHDVIQNLIEQATEEEATNITVIIEADNEDIVRVEVVLADKSINALAESGMSLTVQSDVATIVIDLATLTGLIYFTDDEDAEPTEATIRIIAELVADNEESLSEEQFAVIGSNLAFILKFMVGDYAISNFSGIVTVIIPYTPCEDFPYEDRDLLTVYRLGNDEDISEKTGANFDNYTMTFTTNRFSLFFVSDWINPFEDVSRDAWYFRDVRFAYSNELKSETAPGQFSPSANLTVKKLVSMLWQLSEEDYADAISWAYEADIINGLFALDANITREQFVTLIYNFAQYKELDTYADSFTTDFRDIDDISPWAIEAMQWAYANGIITRRTLTTIAPNATVTRAESSAILQRFMEM